MRLCRALCAESLWLSGRISFYFPFLGVPRQRLSAHREAEPPTPKKRGRCLDIQVVLR